MIEELRTPGVRISYPPVSPAGPFAQVRPHIRGLCRVPAFGADLEKVRVPTLLVAGTLDQTSPPAVSKAAFEQISSDYKEFVLIDKATHRSFDSTYCDQMQASGAVFDENADGVVDEAELANTRVILDRHTIAGILSHPTSGKAVEYCSLTTFTSPIDIRPLVASLTGFIVTDTNVPTTRLNTDAFKQEMTKRAVDFFDDVLKRGQ